MASKLAIIAVTGLSVSIVCLGAAAAVGARQWSEHGFDLFDFGGDSCGFDRAAQSDTRMLDWDGGDAITIAVAANVHYRPGTARQIVAKGDPRVLSHLRVRDGRIEWDCHGWHNSHGRIDLTLPGQAFRGFSLAGSGDLNLQQIDQPELDINLAGHGDIKADGRVDDLKINIAGSGNVDMAALSTKRADVNIMGKGDADIAPSDDADINIMGKGDVRLHGEPAHVETHIMGSGNIDHLASGK